MKLDMRNLLLARDALIVVSFFCAPLAVVAAAAFAQAPPSSPTVATVEHMSPIVATDGFCVDAGSPGGANLFASAPAHITSKAGKARFIEVCHEDSAAPTTVAGSACVSFGSTSQGGLGSTLVCDPESAGVNSANTVGLLKYHECRKVTFRRGGYTPATDGSSRGVVPEVWAASQTAGVRLCVTLGY